MTIPGHAPRPTSPASKRHHGPSQRDAGLDRISQVTKWTLAGGLALTGGFAVVAPVVLAGQGHAKASATTQPVAPATVAPTTAPPATVAPETVPPTTAPVAVAGPRTTPTTAPRPRATLPPQTTLPPQPIYLPPVRTYSPPVIVSGGS